MSHLRGPFFALLAAILFGISPPLAKRLIGEIDPHLLAGLLYLGSGVGLAAMMALRHFAPVSGPPLKRIARNEWGWLVGAIAFGGVIAPVLLMRGLSGTAATTASLLLNFEAVFTAVLAWLLFREGVNGRVLVGFLSILVGGLTVSWTAGAGLSLSSAALLIVAACACWGIDNNLTRKVSHADALMTATLKGLTAGLVNVLLALGAGARWPAMAGMGSALALGFVSYGLSLVCFIIAMRHVGAARTGAYFATAPFIGALVAALFFREHVALNIWVGGVLMLVGVWLHLTESRQQVEAAMKSAR